MVECTLEQCNRMDAETFVEEFGDVYESSPWVAERVVGDRPFESVSGVRQAMQTAVDSASIDRQRALLRAHPDLGAQTEMTDASVAEQESAGLDQLSKAQYERFQRLNDQYREQFGFPFIMAVRDADPDTIEDAMADRVENDPTEEFQTALEQVHTIAKLRLETGITE